MYDMSSTQEHATAAIAERLYTVSITLTAVESHLATWIGNLETNRDEMAEGMREAIDRLAAARADLRAARKELAKTGAAS